MIAIWCTALKAPDKNGPSTRTGFQPITIVYGSFMWEYRSKVNVFREEGEGVRHDGVRNLNLVKCGKNDDR